MLNIPNGLMSTLQLPWPKLAAFLFLATIIGCSSEAPRSCISDTDCGDTTKYGCDLSTETNTRKGTCVSCGGPKQICCGTATCNSGLSCILTPDLPRYCSDVVPVSDGSSSAQE